MIPLESSIVKNLSSLISARCVNDPLNNVSPDDQCVSRVREVMNYYGIEPKILERNGFKTLYHIEGSGKPVVMLMAHYDVVPAGPNWETDPFTPVVRDGKVFGRGALDDLANVVAILEGYGRGIDIDQGTLIIAFTGDEEIGGRNGALALKEKLFSEGIAPTYLVNGDGSGLAIINRRRNVFSLKVEIGSRTTKIRGRANRRLYRLNSRSYHSAYFIGGADIHPFISLARDLIENPNLYVKEITGQFVKSNVLPQEIVAILVDEDGNSGEEIEIDESLTNLVKALMPLTRLSVEHDFPSIYGITVNPNVYRKENGIHILEIDIRAPLKTSKKLEESIEKIIGEYLSDARIKVSSGIGYLDTDRGSKIVQVSSEVLRKLGIKPHIVERAGASDSRFYSPHGVESIDFGPIGGNVHGPNEYVDIRSIGIAARFYRDVASKLLV